ncbi:MAG: hypothetical protein ACFFCV_11685 [Promethearchaeota archaeon]
MKLLDTKKKKLKFLNDLMASDFIPCVNCGKLEDAEKIKWIVFQSKKVNCLAFLCEVCYKKDKIKFKNPLSSLY